MEAYNVFSFIINTFVDGTLCATGCVTNALAICIFHRDKAKNSNVFLLQALAVYDIVFLMYTLFYTVFRSLLQHTHHLTEYNKANPYIIAFVLPVGWVSQTGTIWVTMLVAMDRYLAISHPFRAISVCTLTNAKRAVAIITALAISFNIPRFIYYYYVGMDTSQNSTFVAHKRISLDGWNSTTYYYVYHIGLTWLCLFLVPLSALVIFNTCLIRALKESAREGTKLNKTTDMMAKGINTAVTLNLVFIITKFIICETPDFIAAILGTFQHIRSRTEFKYFSTIKEMLLVFNSAVNFYIYLIFNQKFRTSLRYICHKCRHSRDTSWDISGHSANFKNDSTCNINIIALTDFKTKL